MEFVQSESRAIHHAALTGLGVNAPGELPKWEDAFWSGVNPTTRADAVDVLDTAAQLIAQVALAERIARRQRRRMRGN